jgi:hypothetical protein
MIVRMVWFGITEAGATRHLICCDRLLLFSSGSCDLRLLSASRTVWYVVLAVAKVCRAHSESLTQEFQIATQLSHWVKKKAFWAKKGTLLPPTGIDWHQQSKVE